jgi:hypothetical protein
MYSNLGLTKLFRTSKSKISGPVFSLEDNVPHLPPEAEIAFVSQMKANIEFSSRPESTTKASDYYGLN